jgi:DNA-binding transcriptional LysR family regulator
MDPHLRDLRYFIAVAEELNFTRAATERLFIAQPTLSRQIRLLEAALRARLFERDHRSVRLTPAGEILLTRARLLLSQWDETQGALAEAAAAAEMTLRVGFHTRIGRGLIPAVTARMARLLPGWKLTFRQVSWRDPTAGLGSAEVDVAIAWLPVPDTGLLCWQVVATEERWVALPAKHRLAERAAVTLEDLASEPFIALPATAGPPCGGPATTARPSRCSPASSASACSLASPERDSAGGICDSDMMCCRNRRLGNHGLESGQPAGSLASEHDASASLRTRSDVTCLTSSRHRSKFRF